MNESDCKLVQQLVDDTIVATGLRMSGRAIYEMLKADLSDQTPAQFCKTLSIAVTEGEITGVQAYRGRSGGYGPPVTSEPPSKEMKESKEEESLEEESKVETVEPVAEPEKTSATQPEPVQPRNVSKFARHVWVGRRLYRVRGTFEPLEDIVFKVLRGIETKDGEVVFNGKRYQCDAQLFERIIVYCLHAWGEGESDPVLDDGSGIPVELRIAG